MEKTSVRDSEYTQDNVMSIFEPKIFKIGTVVDGVITQINEINAMVDVGCMTMGLIPVGDLPTKDGSLAVKEGDFIEVILDGLEKDGRPVQISIGKNMGVTWESLKETYVGGLDILGLVKNQVKGGFSVDIGVPAFLPGSQVDLHPVSAEEVLGKAMNFKIITFNEDTRNVIVSRRAILEKEREANMAEAFARIIPDSVVKGDIKAITKFGLFLDLGGVDGLVHISEVSWGKITDLTQEYTVGQNIEVKVVNVNAEEEKIELSIKRLLPDPWIEAAEKFKKGTKIRALVTSTTEYGIFVEVAPMIRGLIYTTEISHQRVKNPASVVEIGQEIEAIVLEIDPGTTIESKIKAMTDFGIFLGIDEGIDGMVHISDISWTGHIKTPAELYHIGETIRAKIIRIDPSSGRIALGVKQLEPDPWDTVGERFPVGTKICGTVTGTADYGVFLSLEGGLRGLVHVSEIPKDLTKNLAGSFPVGSSVEAKVVSINKEERKMAFSINKMEGGGPTSKGKPGFNKPRFVMKRSETK